MFTKRINLSKFKEVSGYFIVQEDDSICDALSETCYLLTKDMADIEVENMLEEYPEAKLKILHIQISES